MRQEFVSNCWGSSLFSRCSPFNTSSESLSIATAPPVFILSSRLGPHDCTAQVWRWKGSETAEEFQQLWSLLCVHKHRMKGENESSEKYFGSFLLRTCRSARVCVCVCTRLSLIPQGFMRNKFTSLGQGQLPIAIHTTKTGIKEGTWIILQGRYTPTLRDVNNWESLQSQNPRSCKLNTRWEQSPVDVFQ